MSPIINAILDILPPPMIPANLDRTWEDVERDLRVSLPNDYKEFINCYGSGFVCKTLYVWNFRDADVFPDPLMDTLLESDGVLALYKDLQSMQNVQNLSPNFPEPRGLLPFATLIDVHHLNWLTVGAPETWEVVFWYSDGLEFIHLEGDSFSRFLLKAIKNEYPGNDIPRFSLPYTFDQEKGSG